MCRPGRPLKAVNHILNWIPNQTGSCADKQESVSCDFAWRTNVRIEPTTRLTIPGVGKNRFSVSSQYLAWRYCINSKTPSIDILSHKFLINVANTNSAFWDKQILKINWLFNPLFGAKCSLSADGIKSAIQSYWSEMNRLLILILYLTRPNRWCQQSFTLQKWFAVKKGEEKSHRMITQNSTCPMIVIMSYHGFSEDSQPCSVLSDFLSVALSSKLVGSYWRCKSLKTPQNRFSNVHNVNSDQHCVSVSVWCIIVLRAPLKTHQQVALCHWHVPSLP